MGPDATSEKDLVRSHLVISKFLKMFTRKVTGKPPATYIIPCQVLAQQDGADRVVGFFRSLYRKTDHKIGLTAFRRKKLEDGFDNGTSLHGRCGNTGLLIAVQAGDFSPSVPVHGHL